METPHSLPAAKLNLWMAITSWACAVQRLDEQDPERALILDFSFPASFRVSAPEKKSHLEEFSITHDHNFKWLL